MVKGRRLITFNGTSGQVAAAFHTSMHSDKVGGETHIANSTDISVPSAIKEVLASAPSLNDFASQPLHTRYRQVPRGNDGQYVESVDGNFTIQTSGNHFMSPGDFAKTYNTTASGMDVSGVTIGIVGRSNILLAVQAYRRHFGLPDN